MTEANITNFAVPLDCQQLESLEQGEDKKFCGFENELLTWLEQSLDPETLMATFYQKMKTYLAISKITFYGQNQIITESESDAASYFLNMELISEQGADLGRLQIGLNKTLSAQQEMLLQRAVDLLAKHLSEALDHLQVISSRSQEQLLIVSNTHSYAIGLQNALKSHLSQQHYFSLLKLQLNGFEDLDESLDEQDLNCILREFSIILTGSIGTQDQIFRCGSNDFVVILNDIQSVSVKEISLAIQQKTLNTSALLEFHLSCSIGHVFPRSDDSIYSLLERLDKSIA